MMKVTYLTAIAAITALGFNGCVNQEMIQDPTVQGGAAAGAVAGAVIGGNVGDKSGTNIALGAATGAVLGGVAADALKTPKANTSAQSGWE